MKVIVALLVFFSLKAFAGTTSLRITYPDGEIKEYEFHATLKNQETESIKAPKDFDCNLSYLFKEQEPNMVGTAISCTKKGDTTSAIGTTDICDNGDSGSLLTLVVKKKPLQITQIFFSCKP